VLHARGASLAACGAYLLPVGDRSHLAPWRRDEGWTEYAPLTTGYGPRRSELGGGPPWWRIDSRFPQLVGPPLGGPGLAGDLLGRPVAGKPELLVQLSGLLPKPGLVAVRQGARKGREQHSL
jgi:hypothetical protein